MWTVADLADLTAKAVSIGGSIPELPGEDQAANVIVTNTYVTYDCAACADSDYWFNQRHAIAYGQPVSLCDEECYLMLMANWQDIQGRV